MTGSTQHIERDGTRVAGYLAEPGGCPRGVVVVIQRWWALSDDIRSIADSRR